MRRKQVGLVLLGLFALATIGYNAVRTRATALVLTGIVTTNDVIVSPQIGGQITSLLVNEGQIVKSGQLLAVIAPDELRADSAFYAHSAEGLTSQVKESEAALRLQEQQTGYQIRQAEAALASTEAQEVAAEADQENARLVSERAQQMSQQGIVPIEQFDQARTGYEAAKARVASLRKQIDAARAAVSLARSTAEQISVKRSQVQTNQLQQQAASAQQTKADVRLTYTEIHAPIDAVVDVRAVRQGEVVALGQPLLTLINPDDLWVRADVEETYIEGITIGGKLTVRLPSGVEREGTVFYRGVDAAFATQRDVSRTKRDIKTFEVRLRVDNSDRRLAVGMTAYVLLPLK